MPQILCPNCEESIFIDELSDPIICPECGEEFDTDEIEGNKRSGGLVSIIIIIALILLISKLFSGPKWTLFICSSLQNEGYRYECSENALILENSYKSLDDCFSAGKNYLNIYPGFECGYKCNIKNDFRLWVCDRINE